MTAAAILNLGLGGGRNAVAAAYRQQMASSSIHRRSLSFTPRRTPPPHLAGINLRPRSDPLSPPAPPPIVPTSSSSTTIYARSAPDAHGRKYRPNLSVVSPKTELGGAGRTPGWISPHHIDHYGRVDTSTLDHPYLMHGDPHQPIGKLARGEGKVVLHPITGKNNGEVRATVEEEGTYSSTSGRKGKYQSDKLVHRAFAATKGVSDDDDDNDNNLDNDDEDIDLLEREYGSDAADAIRHHLASFRARLNTAKDVTAGGGDESSTTNNNTTTTTTTMKKKIYSPLNEIEERFRTIDRLTSAPGSTQDLALQRRARTESRDFFRSSNVIPGLGGAGGKNSGDDDDDDHDVYNDDDETGNVGRKKTAATTRCSNEIESEFGHGRGYDAQSVFGTSSTVTYPYGKDLPSPTYHPDFPRGSNVGNDPVDVNEEAWVKELNKLIYEEQYTEFELGDIDETYTPVNVQKEEMDAYLKERRRTAKYNILEREDEHEKDREEKPDEILEMIKNGDDPNQEAFGPWGECTIKLDRVQKPERGGTTVRYRALVIGGNGNGAAGFGIGKAASPNEAIVKACKHCKRNVFYVDRYLNTGLSYDLAGKHNSCRVRLRAVSPDYGLHGHPLIVEILKYAGISDACGKSHGNRNPYNVVYATFKALMTHESLEEIAMKRGKKLLNLQRARRLGI